MGRQVWASALAAVSVLALGAPVLAQAPAAAPAPAAVAAPKKMEVFTSMRDGTKLAANVFLPEGKGPLAGGADAHAPT